MGTLLAYRYRHPTPTGVPVEWIIVAAVAWVLPLLLVGVAIRVLAKRARMRPPGPPPVRGFSVETLERMHREGALSDEEFERARRIVVTAEGQVRSPPAAPAKPVSRGAVGRVGPRTCPTCGYDLRATPERCPECGRMIGGS